MSAIVLFVPVLVLMSGLFHIVPELTRPGLFFGVSVPPGFRQTREGRRILVRFRTILWSFTAIAVAMEVVSGMELVAMLCLGGGFLWALISVHRQSMAHAAVPSGIREVELAAPRERLPGGWVVAALPILFLAGLALWAGNHWDRLPDRFPVHWSIHGPDHWVARTPATVYGFLFVHASICILLVAIAWGLLHWSRHISTSGASSAAERRFRRRVVEMLLASEYFLVFPAWIALFHPAPAAMGIWGLALGAVITGFTVSLIHTGQGGSRGLADAGGDGTPDSCWKWGLVYINPADPSILIEKRFGIGYTLNLGNRWSWVVMALLLAPAAFALVAFR